MKKITKVFTVSFILLLICSPAFSQEMFGFYAGRTTSLASKFGADGDAVGSGFYGGAGVLKWKNVAKANKFRVRSIGVSSFKMTRGFNSEEDFVSGTLQMVNFEATHGWLLGKKEADETFYTYFTYSYMLGLGQASFEFTAKTQETNVFVFQPINLGLGINRAIGNNYVFRLEGKVGPSLGKLNSAFASVQAFFMWKLY